jgi:hypothetical protein
MSQHCRYPDESHFCSHIHMARHGFGKGEYRYFKYNPLTAPPHVAEALAETAWTNHANDEHEDHRPHD